MFHRIAGYCLFSCLFCLTLSLLSGCTNKNGGGPVGPGASGPPPKPEVIVDSVGQDDVQLYIYADGRTVPSNSVEMRTRVSGYLEELFFKPGAIVKEGEQLALIEQATYQVALDAARAELASSKAQASLADANLERAKILIESKTISPEEYQTYLANRDMALAKVELANANVRNAELNLQYTDMRSPITGKTTKNLVDIGNYVSPTGSQAVILSVAQLDPMYIEFKLSDRQFSDMKDRIGFREAFNRAINTQKDEDTANINSSEQPIALTGIPIDVSLMTGVNVLDFDFNVSGKIIALVDNQIDFATGQVTLRAKLRNPLLKTEYAEDYLIYPGQVCRVRIPYEKVSNAVLIREEAILTDLDTKYVLVVADGIVYRRDIKIGRLLDTQMRIVQKGLEPGETYIVKGVQRVRIGIEVKPTTLEEYNVRRTAEAKNSHVSVKQDETRKTDNSAKH